MLLTSQFAGFKPYQNKAKNQVSTFEIVHIAFTKIRLQ